jgi:prepilin-type N-terminal cleavage/methylation domain-containing protein
MLTQTEKTEKTEKKINSIKIPSEGFSLIELLIVITIIGIIAAIAIPNLLNARRASNEASAISSVSLIFRSEMTYKSTTGSGEFTDIAGLYSANFVDEVIGTGSHIKSGYQLQIDVYPSAPPQEARFDLRARPVIHAVTNPVVATGGRDFGTNEVGGIFETNDNTPVTFGGTTRLPLGTAVPIDGN